jgi:O-antigen ligase
MGCLVACFLFVGYALFFSAIDFENTIKYINFYHHTYFALLLNVAVIMLIWQKGLIKNYLYLKIIFASVFLAMIYFTNSRTGLFTSLFIVAVFLIRLLVTKRRNKWGFVIVGFCSLAIIFFILKHERVRAFMKHTRQENMIDIAKQTGNERILLWSIVVKAAQDNWLTGLGTGSSLDYLKKKYRQEDMDYFAEQGLNAHNQFFEIIIDVGIGGVVLLLLLFVVSFFHAIKKKDMISIMILSSFFIGFMFESMLNRFVGTVAFMLFISLQFINDKYLSSDSR